MGKCAFRPVWESADQTELEVEHHWLPKQSHGPLDNVLVSTTTINPRSERFRWEHNDHVGFPATVFWAKIYTLDGKV